MASIDVASNTALVAVAEKLTEQNEILRGMSSGGGKQYLHNIVMRDPDMGDFPVGHFCSSDSTPITSTSEIPVTFTLVRVLNGNVIGSSTFIPNRFNVSSSGELFLYGYDFDGGDADVGFSGWAVIDTVTEV